MMSKQTILRAEPVNSTHIILDVLAAHRLHAGIVDKDDPEKLGALKTVVPLCLMLGLVWALFLLHSRKKSLQEDSPAYVALCAASFTVCSASMHTLNKVCVSLTDTPSTITCLQMIIAVICFLVVHYREVLGSDKKQMLRWSVVPILYAAMLNSSLFGYQYLTLTLVTVFRNLAPMVTLAFEQITMPPEHRPLLGYKSILAMLMMVFGAVLFAGNDHAFSWFGLGLVAINTLFAIFDRLLQRRLLVAECKDLPSSTCMVINNGLGLIPTLALAGLSHELDTVKKNLGNWMDPAVITLIILSGIVGLGIGLFGLMCQKVMTATSFQVLQNLSKVLVVAVGVGLFGDKVDSPLRVTGILLSFVGSAAYGYTRSQEGSGAKKEEQIPLNPGRITKA